MVTTKDGLTMKRKDGCPKIKSDKDASRGERASTRARRRPLYLRALADPAMSVGLRLVTWRQR